MRYLVLSQPDLQHGQHALRLYLEDGLLCAGTIERRPDGRLHAERAGVPGTDGILPTIASLLNPASDCLLVVLEPGAYWPDAFPRAEKIYADFHR